MQGLAVLLRLADDGQEVRHLLAELLARHVGQVVGVLARFEQIARDGRVEVHAAEGHSVTRQDGLVPFDVARDLRERRVLEERAEDFERRRHRELFGGAEITVAERHVPRDVAPRRQAEAHQLAVERVLIVHRDEGHHAPRFAERRRDLFELARRRDDAQILSRRDLGRRRGQLLEQPVELELGEERPQHIGLAARPAQLLEVELDVHVVSERHQLLRQVGLVLVLFEGLLDRLLLHLFEVRVDAVEVPVGLEELDRGLRPHPLDARHVVGAVAHQREVVAQLRGRHAHLLLRLVRVVDLVAHRVPHHDAVAHELEQILVRARDDDLETLFARFLHDGGDHVVRLHLFGAEHGDAVGPRDLEASVTLLVQVGRRLLAGRLVLGKDLLAERGRHRVDRDGQVHRLLLLDHLQEHVGEAVDRVGRLAARGREGRQGVIGPKDVATHVEDVECLLIPGRGQARIGHGTGTISPHAPPGKGSTERSEAAQSEARRRGVLRGVPPSGRTWGGAGGSILPAAFVAHHLLDDGFGLLGDRLLLFDELDAILADLAAAATHLDGV